MLRSLIARALIACICMAPAGIALGDVSWQADSGNTNLILDLDSLANLGVDVKSDGAELQPGVFRVDLVGPSDLSIDAMSGSITATSGGTLLHVGQLSLISVKEGSGLSLDNLAFEVPSGNDITSLNINDAATGQTLFRVDSVRAVYAPVSRVLALEGGSLVGTKALATSMHIEALDGAVLGQLHARFNMEWAGGDAPSSDPGFPVSGGSPRGTIDCNGSTGQDLIVGVLTTLNNPSSEQIGGVWYDTFSVGTTSCNIGDQILTWDGSSGFVHPVIGQNCFRLKDGRFEQIGQSWLKHGFTVAAGNSCGCGCTGPGGPTLYPGCSDPYGATLNNSQGSIKPKWRVNPTLGTHDHAESAPAITGNASRRLQVRHTDVNPTLNTGAIYFVEGQYVHAEDSASGNANNNASYSQITVASAGTNEYTFSLTGSTNREDSGIRAWQDTDPTVTESDVIVPNEGLYIIASKATNNGNGTWHYEYAVQNLNGNRGASSFSVPIDPSATVSNIGFHDVDYHSGDGEGNVSRDGTDWNGVHTGSSVTWTMSDVGLNSNALLWGTMYNFRFDANRPPAANNPNATLTHWRSGSPATSQGAVQGPDIGPQDCQPNGVEDGTDIANGTSQDCNNDGVPDECQTFTPSTLTTEIVVSGLGTDKPVFVCAPPGDTSRLFIVTQVGRIYIYNLVSQTLNGTPFLDISGQTTTDGERGLLGMAFHPNYASNGKFYINNTNLSGNTLIREFSVSGNPDIADAGSAVTLKTINQDFSNHNAGCLQFSPIDGMLYCPMGDGGGANDSNERAQDDNSLLGKILRLDVDNAPTYIPSDNPGFTLPEVWAKGMRNPWRFSFDRLSGDIYIGDVGQDTREEVDFQSAASAGGENYGWDCREGLIAAPGQAGDGFGCNSAAGGYTDPILDYNTQDGNNCTIIGGYVYRGCAIPWLNGTYFYADWCADWVKTFRYDGSTLSDQQDVTADLNDGIAGTMTSIVSFGEDAAGELYIVTYGGTIYRIIEAGPPPVCGNNAVENGEQCDDGNTTAGDGCSPTCQNEIPVCGNNLVDVGEQCDDGNTNNGDGCDSMCQSENIPGANNCADAPPIADGVYDFDTSAASTDGTAHASCEFDGQTYNDIWWQYNATCSGNLTVSLCGSGYDTDLVIYNTCTCTPGDANLAGCNDDGCPGSAPDTYRSQLTVPVTAGSCYLIRVGGWNSGDRGVGTMTISNDGAPCNTCGNGTLEAGEQCDDGNTTNGDGCSGVCMFEFDDCNNNSIDDLVDIAMGTSQDCNSNSIPDECETGDDCNNNGILDACELANGSAADCNDNGVLDVCESPVVGAETKTYDIPLVTPTPIPDNSPAGLSDTFTVPDSGTIQDVDVEIELTHTYIGDLCITLTHNGTTIQLAQRPGADNGSGTCHSGSPFGCAQDDLNARLDDEGTGGALEDLCVAGNASPPSYTPFEALSAFDGMDKTGNWTLTVSDNAGSDTGNLIRWALIITNDGGVVGNDCNNNGIDDVIDMAQGTESDCDGNCIPDSCEIASNAALDCNSNGTLDSCELAGDPSLDCDGGPIGDPAGGQTIFMNNACFGCHNSDGSGGPGFPGPNIRNKSRTFIAGFLPAPTTHPGGAFNFTPQQFADLEAFLSDTGGRGRPDGVLDTCQAPLPDCDMDGQSDGCELNSGTQVDLDHSGVPDDCEGALTGACCMSNGSCIVETESECMTAGGTYQGDSVGCTPNPCPQPTGACCFSDGSCSVETSSDCSLMGGTYQGDGAACSPNPCPQPMGACCFGDGSCSVELAVDCPSMGGIYQGDGSVCTPNPCPLPTGACCAGDGTCSIVTEDDCITGGGTYQGDGASCSPNPCPQPTGACCFGDGSCFEETSADCATAGGTYHGNNTVCTPNPCDQPMGSCCMVGSCSEATESDCINAGGEYLGDDTTCAVTGCPPANDDCVDALPIFNGVTPFSTIDATTDGRDEPGVCTKFNDTQVGSDIWYCYVATCNGDLTVSTCGDATYDTKLAIYDGCTCPAENTIACQDDSSGCGGNTTTLTVSVVQGNSYLIRVGGYNNNSGTGNLTITCDGTCSGSPDGDLNEDGSVNGLDIHNLVDGLINGATPAYICHGDYDGSSDLDMADVPFIVDALLGL